MKFRNILNILILFILFIGNIIINNHKYYFFLIYLSLLLFNIYIVYLIIKYGIMNKKEILWFLFVSLFSYLFSYFIICDPNPFFCIITYYIFFQNFFKAVLIIIFHTYIFSTFSTIHNYDFINNNGNDEKPRKSYFDKKKQYFFLSNFIKYFKNRCILFLILLLFLMIDIIIFINRIKIWIYFNNKEKTLPVSSTKNTTFYLTAMVVNMESIIINFIEEMKKLIYYFGKENVIISIVENGDSKDKTREYLKEFKTYLDRNNIINKFILRKEVLDPRKKSHARKYGPLRIKFYSLLRNKCLDFIYEIPNLDFENTKIIFFNDIYYQYEDIINLISTNNEDYDAVCALDFDNYFYDRWVSIDLDGNSLLKNFPFIVNKEAQDQILNHKPFRVFSCWNGVIVFTAAPLKNKTLQFRYTKRKEKKKYKINNCQRVKYESECTYLHIDLFNLGYTKKFVNPEVRVTYEYQYYLKRKYYYPFFRDIKSYFILYFKSFQIKRNKFMSDYKSKKVVFNSMVQNWYFENKKKF